jgi:hypothetical protein
VLVVMLLLVVLALVIPIVFKGTRPALTAAGGLLAAVAALGYALLTFSLVDATERLTRASADALEAQTRPNVIIHVELHGFMLFLVIENMGAGEAFEVRFDREGDFAAFPDQLVADAAFWAAGLGCLAPKQRLAYAFMNTTRPLPADPRVRVTVHYRSRGGRHYDADFPFNASELMNVAITYSADERALGELEGIHEEMTQTRRILGARP